MYSLTSFVSALALLGSLHRKATHLALLDVRPTSCVPIPLNTQKNELHTQFVFQNYVGREGLYSLTSFVSALALLGSLHRKATHLALLDVRPTSCVLIPLNTQKNELQYTVRFSKLCRARGIRTHDPLVPNQMRYQTALSPELKLLY